MPALNVEALRKSYGGRVLFADVSFSMEEGEKVGLVGVNGSGKTTLLRILAGVEGSEGGALSYRRGLTVGYLAQEPEFEEGETVLSAVAGGSPELMEAIADYQEAVRRIATASPGPGSDIQRLVARQAAAMERIEALGGWDYEHRLEAVLTRLRVVGWERPMAELSGGERKRVALARVLVQQPDLLLLDEPTNHLDVDVTEWLEETLLTYPGAVMLVTHDRYFLDRVVTRMLEVNRAQLISYSGGFTEYLAAKAEREERLATEEARRSKLIAQELAWVKRSPKARTGKQKARIQRLERVQREQESERGPAEEVVEMRFGRPPRLGRTVLDLDGLGKSYDGQPLIRDFSTRLRAGERIGVVGPNGAGKTTLLRLILGEEAPDSGEVKPGVNTRLAYYAQDRSDLDPDANLLESVASTDWVQVGNRRVHIRSYLDSFLFPNEMHEQKVGSLSGGERNRLLLARLLLQNANLLLMDEPTNDLDIFTLQILESALVDFHGCALVVTHDRYFLDKVATALFVFEGDGRIHRHEGGYHSYRLWKTAMEEAAAPKERERATRPKGGGGSRGRATVGGEGTERPRRLSYRERQELEGMEAAITAAEAERDRLEAALADPSLYSQAPETVPQLSLAFEDARRAVDDLYARWSELEAIREGSEG